MAANGYSDDFTRRSKQHVAIKMVCTDGDLAEKYTSNQLDKMGTEWGRSNPRARNEVWFDVAHRIANDEMDTGN